MKKIILILTAVLILTGLYIPSNAATLVPERVRIGLKYGATAQATVSLASENGFSAVIRGDYDKPIAEFNDSSVIVRPDDSYMVITQEFGTDYNLALSYISNSEDALFYYNGNYFAVKAKLFSQEAVNSALETAKSVNPNAYAFSGDSVRVRVENQAGKALVVFSQKDSEYLSLGSKNDGLVSFDGIKYREYLEMKRNGQAIEVISNISMQAYLYGVVPSEIGASAPFEAQKAQAVCARTYTVKNLNRHSKNGFNLCATTCCQVYFGTKNESRMSNNAVDETNRQIITYNGELITAVYSAHTGGVTANVENVWGSPYPYLKSVPDPHCTDYNWTIDLDYSVISASLNAKGYNLGEVTGITIDQTSSDNRVLKMTITGTQGTKTVERESARTILGLKSQMFYISGGTLMKNILTPDGTTSQDIIKKTIMTANGIKTPTSSISVINGKNNVTTLSISSGNKIVGKGYGHGVGLCQCGAMGFAREGWDYIKILKYYYTGVEIQ